MEQLLRGDQIRTECLMESGYYKDGIVINIDFYFTSTMFRAIKAASL